MNSLPRPVLYYGTEDPLPETVPLRAGPLTLIYEAGDLRYIRLGDREIIRRLYVALRDRNWGTIVPHLSDVTIERAETAFRITYEATHRRHEIDFVWQGTITGDARGTIRFTMDGQARSTFLRNRIGFCVLHPGGECAGRPFTAIKEDGSIERGSFPRDISPHQPVKDLRIFRHEVMSGLEAELQFEGETFEMEDQRNWTDASYKTYGTPLRIPYPVEVSRGTRIQQAVTLRLVGGISEPRREAAKLTFSVADSPSVPLPRLGLGVAGHGRPLSSRELNRLRALQLAHLRVDLALSEAGWEAALRRATDEADALKTSLEVAVILSNEAPGELDALVAQLAVVKPPVATWLIFHREESSTTERWIKLARRALDGRIPGARIGSGTNHFFTELNRERPPVALLDLVSYSINPQVHAFDKSSLVETLEAQRWTVESARRFVGDVPLAVSPVTLKMRFNPNATTPEPDPRPDELPSQVDPLQMSLLGAGWTLGSLKYLSESAVASATYFETTGWRGVMETDAGSPAPARFRSVAGGVFPVYHILADVGDFVGGEVVPTRSSAQLLVDGLALQKGGRKRVLLANLSHETRTVHVSGLRPRVRVRQLDELTAEDAMRAPDEYRAGTGELVETSGGTIVLTIRPYAITRIDATD
ncbi:MAG TPA: hypothetical protein VFZ25_15935 [Chloroflexota bacterium]|nr:hypothetical protein [Chloroflexota bacterium]